MNPEYLADFSAQQKIAFQNRINRKSLQLKETTHHETFNRLVARVFGGKSNGDVFEGLLEKQVSNNLIEDAPSQKTPSLIRRTFIEEAAYNERYVRKGHRPQSNAQKRLNEWLLFTEKYQISDEIQTKF